MALRSMISKGKTVFVFPGAYTALLSTVVVLLLPGCSRNQPEETINMVSSNVIKEVEIDELPAIEIPTLYSSPAQQQRFEKLYVHYESIFQKPVPGTLLRIIKTNGLRVEGPFLRFTKDGIAISTEDGPVMVQRNEMSDATLEQVFPDRFSRNLAVRQMDVESARNQPAIVHDIFFDSRELSASETRRFTAEHMYARHGPGRYFNVITNAELFRGQNVYVIHETNDWICVMDRTDSQQPLGWIPKFSSFVPNPENKTLIAAEVERLLDAGFVIDITPKKNEALVDGFEWKITDSASIEGKSRLLAFYCGQQKNSRLYWVDIKDALSGRTLAEYSESKGLRIH